MSESVFPEGFAQREPENLGGGQQEKRLSTEIPPVDLIRGLETRSLYTIVGLEIIEKINSAVELGRIDEIERTIFYDALPVLEGLEKGVYAKNYGLTKDFFRNLETSPSEYDKLILTKFYNLFLGRSESTARPRTDYLEQAINDVLTRPLREADAWFRGDRERWRLALKSSLSKLYQEERLQRIVRGEEFLTEEEINEKIRSIIEEKERGLDRRYKDFIDSVQRLSALEEHVSARRLVDLAFRQRQALAHNKEAQADPEKFGYSIVKIEAADFLSFYQYKLPHEKEADQSPWGEAVDRVERRMIEIAEGKVIKLSRRRSDGSVEEVGYNPFAEGFSSSTFARFLHEILKASQVGDDPEWRLDVVWAAWRMFLLKEMSGKFALTVKEGEFKFDGSTPYVSDLSVWLSYFEEIRAKEFGWNKDTFEASNNPRWNGKFIGERKSPKNISNSGHPITIGHIAPRREPEFPEDKFPISFWGGYDYKEGKWKGAGRLGNYMEFAVLGQKARREEFRGKSLYYIWRKLGINQSDPNFPWMDTVFGTEYADEPSEASFSYWHVQRGRAMKVRADVVGIINHISSLRNLENFGHWQRLGMAMPSERDIRQDEWPKNPFVYRFLAEAAFYFLRTGKEELNFRTLIPQEELTVYPAGSYDQKSRGLSLRTIGELYIQARLISKKEADWVYRMVGA